MVAVATSGLPEDSLSPNSLGSVRCAGAGGRGRIRTSVARKGRQVYSLLPLAARPPVHELRTTESRFRSRTPCSYGELPTVFLSTVFPDPNIPRRQPNPPGSSSLPENVPACGEPLIPPRKPWSGRRESNPRPTAWKAVTLPLSYSRLQKFLEPMTGIEPVTSSLPRTRSTN